LPMINESCSTSSDRWTKRAGKTLPVPSERRAKTMNDLRRLRSNWITTLYMVFLFPGPLSAADIRCLTTWGNSAFEPKTDFGVRPVFDRRFLSGRRPVPSTCKQIIIEGDIVAADSNHFLELLRTNHPFVERVYLRSSGGSISEALKIGRLIRKNLLSTVAPTELFAEKNIGNGVLFDTHGLSASHDNKICEGEECHCASACFLIWAAGVEREGNALGLHRISIQSTEFGNLPPERASLIYRLLLDEARNYMTEMEVPGRFIEMLVDTSSSDIRWLAFAEASSMLEIPSIAEWIGAACGKMSYSQLNEMGEIQLKLLFKQKISSREKTFFEGSRREASQIDSCKARKIENSRDSMKEIEE
jgi:hypothetical protein